MGLVFHLICLFFYTVCITKLCQQRVSRKGTPAAAVGFRADCIEQFFIALPIMLRERQRHFVY